MSTGPKNEIDQRTRPKEFLFPYKYQMKKDLGSGKELSREIDPFYHLGFDAIYTENQKTWKAVQFCRIDRKGRGWHANHGGLYDAIFYPMAKAVTARKSEIPKPSRSGEWRYFWFLFPLVVTAGRLMLINSSEPIPSPGQVDYISFNRDLKSGKLSDSFLLSFVQHDHLNQFVANVVDPIAALATDLIYNRLEFLQKTKLEWVD